MTEIEILTSLIEKIGQRVTRELTALFDFMWANSYQVFFSVVGGLITVAIIEIIKWLIESCKARKFAAIFGNDIFSPNGFHLVYGALKLPDLYDSRGNRLTHPFVKPDQNNGSGFSIDYPVSQCELRAANYISTTIGAEAGRTPKMSSDLDLKGRLDLSFISFGGPLSNYKTSDANTNPGNRLITFLQEKDMFASIPSKEKVVDYENGFDYGMILKVRPSQFPNRVWLVCAGRGEWGTSGAAFYLASKWGEIHKFAKNKAFAMVLKVKPGQDESAEPVLRQI